MARNNIKAITAPMPVTAVNAKAVIVVTVVTVVIIVLTYQFDNPKKHDVYYKRITKKEAAVKAIAPNDTFVHKE